MRTSAKKKLTVYILHSPRLVQRDANMQGIKTTLLKHTFKNLHIQDVQIITTNEPNDISGDIIQKNINYDPPSEEHLKMFSTFAKNLHINQLSQTLKHTEALTRTSMQEDDSWALILEDDAVYQQTTMCDSLDKIAGDMNASHDIIFLGMPQVNTQVNATQSSIVEVNRTEFQLIPIVENYLIHTKKAKQFVQAFTPIKYTCNVQYNYTLAKTGFKCYQGASNIIINGSKYGAFVSSVNPCNPLVFNREYMIMFDICKKIEQGSTITAEIEKEFNAQVKAIGTLKENPDFQYIIAKFMMLSGKFKPAKFILEKSLESLENNHAIINHESWVLRDLIRIHKHLQ